MNTQQLQSNNVQISQTAIYRKYDRIQDFAVKAVGLLSALRSNVFAATCFLMLLETLCVAAPALIAEERIDQPERKPNVLLIVIDDLGYQDLCCNNKSCLYSTPNIDRLAKNGIRFTQFYSAHPVCSPTRAAIMSGKTPQRVGITDWIPQPSDFHLPAKEFTVAEAFSDAGYRTGFIGKWHLGEKDNQQPDSHGFEWMRAVNRAGQPASYFAPFKRNRNRNNNNNNNNNNKARSNKRYWDVPDLEKADKNAYLTDELTDLAIDFVSQKSEQPFFLCFSHYAVHTPIESPKPLVKKYKERFAKYTADPAPVIKERASQTRARGDHVGYAAMIENLDSNIGRLMDALKDAQNTIVVFTSDNGGLSTLKNRIGPASCRPFRAGKGWVYEGGIRIPTIIHWPEKLKAAEVTVPGISMDLYPTMLELAGLKFHPQQHLDGQSLVKLMRGEKATHSRTLGWHYPHRHGSGHKPASAIREGNWKLIHHRESNEYELFDLSNDVSESNNLVATESGVANRMKRSLKEWLQATVSQPKAMSAGEGQLP